MALLVYLDDIVLASSESVGSAKFKAYLHECFSIKDLGDLKYFLGIEVVGGPRGYFCINGNMPLKFWMSVVY